ncbi:MAG: ABC transporter permease subunit [Phycisphaerales bacterium]
MNKKAQHNSPDEGTTRARASRRLHATDAAAEFVVTVGGFSVLAAVLGICFYLAWVVVPLFSPGEVGSAVVSDESSGSAIAELGLPGGVYVDPYGESAVMTFGDRGELVGLSDGRVIGSLNDSRNGDDDQVRIVSESRALNGELIARGLSDGRVMLGSIEFEVGFLREQSSVDQSGDGEQDDELFAGGAGYTKPLEDGGTRLVVARESFGDPVKVRAGSGAAVLLDYQIDTTGKTTLALLREDQTVVVSSVRTIRPLGGGAARTRLRETNFELQGLEVPFGLKVSADGGQVFAVYSDGRMDRYARGSDGFVLRETLGVLEGSTRVTVVEMVLGGQTVLVGDSDGVVQSWHVAIDERDQFGDGRKLVKSHEFVRDGVSVTDLTPSGRDRTIGVLYSDGLILLRHLTSEKAVIRIQTEIQDPRVLAIGPKNDSVLAVGAGGGYELHHYEAGYPEFSIKALFGKVVYEGLAEPEYVYQSSSGDDSSEIKLSVMPLIFGTLKATVFAMLFAIPVAVFAAMYSSEFLSKRVRKVVKPSVELMASLPSVVLGFVAAMVVAPYVAQYLGTFLVGMFVLPLGVLFGAHVWQLVPLSARLKLRTGQHLALVSAVLILSGVVALFTGPAVIGFAFAPDRFDRAMFAGDVVAVDADRLPGWAEDAAYNTRTQRKLRAMELGVVDGVVVERSDGAGEAGLGMAPGSGVEAADMRRWLNGEYGSATAGWMMVCMPMSALLMWFVQALTIRRRIDEWVCSRSAGTVGLVVLAKFVVLAGVSVLAAYAVGVGLNNAGIDPRDSIFGTFSPRNTLVVAVIMGFAVIPIIFTISEDALQAVPDTLRSASLGAGATKWQTAVRVVLPVAGSGIFSACMIGFGRAVGETMIVLMATGNTPAMSWNIFSGFRTLAANIAVELPEAPKDETHYRVLFLCGFVLFVMTFVINTSAEVVRRVVRARNAGL